MQRLALAVFAFVSALSAALFVAVVILWVRSYSTVEALTQLTTLDPPKPVSRDLWDLSPTEARREFGCHLLCGSFCVSIVHMSIGGIYPADMPAPDGWTRTSLPAAGMLASYPGTARSVFGFGYEHRQWRYETVMAEQPELRGVPESLWPKLPPMTEAWAGQIPCWSLAVITAPLPLAWAWWLRRRRRHPAGHCSKCGYDLRASPERCPECGKHKRCQPPLI